jgi:hypothetical protein
MTKLSEILRAFFLDLLRHYQSQINNEVFDPELSRKIDAVQKILDDNHD